MWQMWTVGCRGYNGCVIWCVYFFGGGGGEGKGLDTCVRFKGSVEIRRSKMLFVLFLLMQIPGSFYFCFILSWRCLLFLLFFCGGGRAWWWPQTWAFKGWHMRPVSIKQQGPPGKLSYHCCPLWNMGTPREKIWKIVVAGWWCLLARFFLQKIFRFGMLGSKMPRERPSCVDDPKPR